MKQRKLVPKRVRSRDNHILRLVSIFLILIKKLFLLLLTASWERKVPKNLIGSFGHSNSKGIDLLLLDEPIHMALVFFLFNCNPDGAPKELTILGLHLTSPKKQTKKPSILLSFYFHEVLQYLNIFT